jgi:branched-chain amino acid transport system permease protein
MVELAKSKGGNRRLYLESAFRALAVAAVFLLPRKILILNEIAILGLFALSLDLILGYTGILSLGHPAFLGLGAYGAGLFAKHAGGDPLAGIAVAAGITAVAGFLAGFLELRMVTLGLAMLRGEAANKASHITGGADGRRQQPRRPRPVAQTGYDRKDCTRRLDVGPCPVASGRIPAKPP